MQFCYLLHIVMITFGKVSSISGSTIAVEMGLSGRQVSSALFPCGAQSDDCFQEVVRYHWQHSCSKNPAYGRH